jgi:hypothetical protein
MPKTGDAPAGRLLKYTSYLYKNPKLSEEEFHDHWRKHHGKFPLEAMKKNGVVRYTQYHCTSATRALLKPMVQKRKDHPAAELVFEIADWDAIVQIWFKDFETWEAVAKEPIFGGGIFADESYLFDCARAYTTLGWEEDMLLDGEIVMPGYQKEAKCACSCRSCGTNCQD